MSTLKKISAKIAIDASQESVFAAVTNWESQNKWIYATKVKGVGDDSNKLGGKLAAFTGIGRFGFLDTMTITKWDPPRLCEVTHTGKVVKGVGLFEVSIENGVTYFTWTEYAEIPLGIVGKAGWLLVGPVTKIGLQHSLRRLSRLF